MAQSFAHHHPFQTIESEPGKLRLRLDCPACGFHNLGMDVRCQKCGRRIPPEFDATSAAGTQAAPLPAPLDTPSASRASDPAAVIPVTAPPRPAVAPARPAMPDHVRREIHSKVERFKARRRGETLPLPFDQPVIPDAENLVFFPTLDEEPVSKSTPPRTRRATSGAQVAPSPLQPSVRGTVQGASNPRPPEALPPPPPSISESSAGAGVHQAAAPNSIPATSFDPSSPGATYGTRDQTEAQTPLSFSTPEIVWQHWESWPIAPVSRRLAGLGWDAAYVAAGSALFCAPLYWIAGMPPLNLLLLAGILCGSLVLAVLYGAMFLGITGETPGMCRTGLRIVSFDGRPASCAQRMLRVAGAIVSTGSFLLGYLWAVVDEEKLYWHDHISKTFLTGSQP